MKKYLIPAIIAGAVVLVGATYFTTKASSGVRTSSPSQSVESKLTSEGENKKTEISSADLEKESSDSKDSNATTTPVVNSEQKEGCVIKGNINSSGEKIYHIPGGSSYTKTQIDTSKGEKWFCTEEEAVAAGWRKAKK